MALDDKTLSALSKPQLDTIQKIHDEAIRQGVNPEFAVAIAEAETGGKFLHKIGDKILTSPAGAKGVMQIMPDTAQLYNKKFNLNINPEDEDSNIKGSIFILKDLLGKYKNPRFATAMYNASPKAAGQFVSMYQQDPDKAITSLPEETQKYLYRISKNFNLDDDKATGLYTAQPAEATEGEEKPPPFVPVADTFPPKTEENNNDNQQSKPAGDVVSPGAGALTGALASTVGQYPFTAELEIAKPPPDLDAAEKAASKAQRQFDIAQERLDARVNSGRPIAGGTHLIILEDEYKRSQAALQLAEKQLQDAVAAQKAKVAPAPPAVAANAPAAGSMASATPQIITDPNVPTMDQQTRGIQGTTEDGSTGRARQTTYLERTSQIARNAANADQTLKALDEQGLIDRNKALALTEGISGSTPSGIKVAPDLAGETQNKAELEQKIVDDRAAQERLAQQQEMDRLKNEKILAAQQNSEAQRRFNEAQRAKTSGVTRAQTTMETAEDRARLLAEELDEARRAAKGAPGTTERVLQNTGAKVGKGSNIVKGGLGALGGYEAAKGINTLANLSLSDLQKRYDSGDRSPALMEALKKAAEATVQVTAGTAAAMPAFGPTTSKIKGAGVLGTGALGAYQAWNALNKTALERRKNPQQ